MAKKALVNKANKKPKFAVRAYTRCNKCGRPHWCSASSACAVCACARWRMPASCRACRSPAGELTSARTTNDDPVSRWEAGSFAVDPCHERVHGSTANSSNTEWMDRPTHG